MTTQKIGLAAAVQLIQDGDASYDGTTHTERHGYAAIVTRHDTAEVCHVMDVGQQDIAVLEAAADGPTGAKIYRVYAAIAERGGGIEGCGADSEEFEAATAEDAAKLAAADWDWERDDWDGGDVIVATDDDGDSYHLHRPA